ncbi:MAG: PspC domain-containing protein [Acidimicrobiales bacterium]
MASRPLVRPLDDRKLGGVAAGIADWLGIDRTIVRLAFVLSIVLPGPQVIAYLLAWLVIPSERPAPPPPAPYGPVDDVRS